MKIAKTITDALALMLAFFILIYAATLYVKFNPTEKQLEEQSKFSLFLDEEETAKELLHFAIILTVSGILGFGFRKKPEITVFTGLLCVSFALVGYNFKIITKHPMFLLLFCSAHLFGAIIYCAYLDRGGKSGHASNAALLSAVSCLGTTGYVLFRQNTVRSMEDTIKLINDAGIRINEKIKFSKELINIIKLRMDNYGTSEARDAAYDLINEVEMPNLKVKVLASIDEEQFKYYLSLAIILFAFIVLYFYLRTKLKFIPMLLSVVPLTYAIINIHASKMTALALVILAATVCTFICSFSCFEQSGKGHDTAYDITDEDEGTSVSDTSDEITYT